jgi:hypothetical protein
LQPGELIDDSKVRIRELLAVEDDWAVRHQDLDGFASRN